MDVTFYESILFFSAGKSTLKEDYGVDDVETSNPMAMPVPTFCFFITVHIQKLLIVKGSKEKNLFKFRSDELKK